MTEDPAPIELPLGRLDPLEQRPAARIAEQLRGAIADGTYSPGDRFPSQNELTEWYGVARETVKGALRMLTAEGLIVAQRGAGTYVAADAAAKAAGYVGLAAVLDEVRAQAVQNHELLTELLRRTGPGGRPGLTIDVAMAPPIAEDSWLNDPRYEEFRAGYEYAAGCNNAILGLSRIDPEDTYYVWSLIQRGIERHRAAQLLAGDRDTP